MIRVALLLGLLLMSSAHAEVLSVAGKQVPLPAGNWQIVGESAGRVTQGTGLGAYGAMRSVVLVRMSSRNTVDAIAEITANEVAVTDGWGLAADCQRTDLLLTAVRSSAGWDAACFFIGRADAGKDETAPVAWRQAKVWAALRAVALPPQMVVAGFRAANRRDVLDLRIYFRDGTVQTADMAEWAAMMIGCVEAGLKSRLPASLEVPAPAAGSAAIAEASEWRRRQERLDYLRAADVLSAKEHARQSALLVQAEATEAAGDPVIEPFYRLLTYQGLTVTSDALVTFVMTAQSVQAAALTFLQAGLRVGRNYLLGYAWDAYGTSPTRPDVARTVDFAYGRSVASR